MTYEVCSQSRSQLEIKDRNVTHLLAGQYVKLFVKLLAMETNAGTEKDLRSQMNETFVGTVRW